MDEKIRFMDLNIWLKLVVLSMTFYIIFFFLFIAFTFFSFFEPTIEESNQFPAFFNEDVQCVQICEQVPESVTYYYDAVVDTCYCFDSDDNQIKEEMIG